MILVSALALCLLEPNPHTHKEHQYVHSSIIQRNRYFDYHYAKTTRLGHGPGTGHVALRFLLSCVFQISRCPLSALPRYRTARFLSVAAVSDPMCSAPSISRARQTRGRQPTSPVRVCYTPSLRCGDKRPHSYRATVQSPLLTIPILLLSYQVI